MKSILQHFCSGFNWQFAFYPTQAGLGHDDMPVGAAQLTEPGAYVMMTTRS